MRPILAEGRHRSVIAATVITDSGIVHERRARDPGVPQRRVDLPEGIVVTLLVVEVATVIADVNRPPKTALGIVRIAAIDLERLRKLMIDTQVIVVEEYQRQLVSQQIAYRTQRVKRPGLIRLHPGVKAQHLIRHRIEPCRGDPIARKRIARPGSIHIAPRGGGVKDLVHAGDARKLEVTAAHRCRGCAGHYLGDFLLMQPLIAEKEKCLIAAIIKFGNHHRTAHVGIRLHEESHHAVGPRQRRLARPKLIEIQAMLHAARAAIPGTHAV